jgi:flagellar biosynthesis protein FlhG
MMPVVRLEHVLTPLPTHDGARRTLGQIAVDAPGGFRMIPGSAGIARIADLAAHEQRALLDSLIDVQAEADVLLIDCGAGISRSVLSFVAAADASIVVATPEPTSVADAYALIKAMFVDASTAEVDASTNAPLLVVNQVIDDRDAVRVAARLSAVTERFLGVDLRSIGSIAQDVRVAESVRAREPVLLRSPASHASRDIQSVAESLLQHLGLVRTNSTPISPRSRGLMRALARVLRLSGA